MNKFIDLHCHPTLKSMFKEDHKRVGIYNNWNYRKPNPVVSVMAAEILKSQCSYNQIIECSNLIVIALHPIESGMVDNWMLRSLSPLTKLIDRSRLLNIISYVDSPYELLLQELANVIDADPNGNRKIKIIKSMSAYDENDKNTIHVILSVEGGHAYLNKKDDSDNKAQSNFDAFTQSNKILSQTITHAIDNPYANHAWAGKILPKFHYYPTGNGITAKGEAFITSLINKNILIDIKHMSLNSRLDFYKMRNDNGYTNPIIISHGAVNGKKYEDILENVYSIVQHPDITVLKMNGTKSALNDITFNPTTMNLFDEEILEIVGSGGIFGLILDKRILGNAKTFKDFVSTTEYMEWLVKWGNATDANNAIVSNESFKSDENLDKEDAIDDSEEMEENWVIDRLNKDYYEVDQLIIQIIHIYNICKAEEAKCNGFVAIDHICIGSDFDGLIAPIFGAKSADFMGDFMRDFIERLEMLKSKDLLPWKNTYSSEDIAVKLFSNNLKNFLLKHFNEVIV